MGQQRTPDTSIEDRQDALAQGAPPPAECGSPPAGALPEPAAAEGTGEDELQEKLDEALADSFPASDPVSITTSQTEESWNHSPR